MDVMNKHQLSEDEKDFIINCTKFGVWILGQPLDQQYDTNAHVTDKVRVRDLLDELTGDDLKDFRGAGANPEYEDERLFESKEYTYYGINDWVSMLATHEGRLYKNGIRYLGPTKNVRLLFDEMIKLFAERAGMGKPKRSVLNKNRCEWDSDYSKIIMKYKPVPQYNSAQVNIIMRVKSVNPFDYLVNSAT